MKTCFVISPIGLEGTDIRKNADDLFDLIIEPALEISNFKVIRGDMVATASSITDDVIKLIQNSELCIIDLTGHNPNVFYECGRRHETAKPFILIKRKGEEIPFDLKDMRTVDYDLSDPRKTKASIDALRKFVKEYEEIGYGAESSVATLVSISNALNRIERKIEGMGTSSQPDNQSIEGGSISGSPTHVFYNALDVNDTVTAAKALRRFMQISADINLQLDMATALVENYEPAGVPIIRNILEKDFDNLQASKIAIALFGLYTYSNGALTLSNEYKYLKDETNKALKILNLSNIDEAALYNVLASIEYSLLNYPESIKYQIKTIQLVPNEPAYHYNIAKSYSYLNKNEELIDSLDNIIAIYENRDPESTDIQYLEYAKGAFVKLKLNDKAKEVEKILGKVKR